MPSCPYVNWSGISSWPDSRFQVARPTFSSSSYGITNRDDVRYIYSTFPIVERQDRDAYGCYRSLELCLAYMNALAAGRPDVVVEG